MSDPEIVVVRTFLNTFDAELAKSALEAAGIESMIRADDCGGVRPHLWMGGVELLVMEGEVDRAEEVLGSVATDAPADEDAPK